MRLSAGLFPLTVLCALLWAAPAWAEPFDVVEKSIPELQAALTSGAVTSRELVRLYELRIAAYDQAGPKLNAIVTLNPGALADADALDRERRRSGPRGPLHGIPILVKDNYDTKDMPTSGGTLALATLQPNKDAALVARLRAAGAIILGKATMHELAAGVTTISSLTGATRNPYDPARSPGGSSGGPAAAVAASFAAAAMGTDTCGSIRIPAAYQNLFGLRETHGLSSRTGIMPLSGSQDIGGPLARSVTDLAILMDATVGEDPADASTLGAAAHIPKSYQALLQPGGLAGARIGVLREYFGTAPEDAQSLKRIDLALAAMKAAGAEVKDIAIPGLDALIKDSSVIGYEFKFELADYLAAEPNAPVKTLSEIIARGLDHQDLDERLRERDKATTRQSPEYDKALAKRTQLHDLIVKTMAEAHVDVLAYPVATRPPPLIGDPALGTGTCQLSATTGLPAISIPVGFDVSDLPVGLELLGGDFAEPLLLNLAYSWEQSDHPRQAPFSTPRLVNGRAPPPIAFQARTIAPQDHAPTAMVKFRYDPMTATLQGTASVTRLGADKVIAVTLQRGMDDKPGPVMTQLVTPGRTSGAFRLTLRAKDRADLIAGNLFVHLYTHHAPLGLAQAKIMPAAGAAAKTP